MKNCQLIVHCSKHRNYFECVFCTWGRGFITKLIARYWFVLYLIFSSFEVNHFVILVLWSCEDDFGKEWNWITQNHFTEQLMGCETNIFSNWCQKQHMIARSVLFLLVLRVHELCKRMMGSFTQTWKYRWTNNLSTTIPNRSFLRMYLTDFWNGLDACDVFLRHGSDTCLTITFNISSARHHRPGPCTECVIAFEYFGYVLEVRQK